MTFICIPQSLCLDYMWPSFLCVLCVPSFLWVQKSPLLSYKDTSHWLYGPPCFTVTLTWVHLLRLCFQIRSHSWVPGPGHPSFVSTQRNAVSLSQVIFVSERNSRTPAIFRIKPSLKSGQPKVSFLQSNEKHSSRPMNTQHTSY